MMKRRDFVVGAAGAGVGAVATTAVLKTADKAKKKVVSAPAIQSKKIDMVIAPYGSIFSRLLFNS